MMVKRFDVWKKLVRNITDGTMLARRFGLRAQHQWWLKIDEKEIVKHWINEGSNRKIIPIVYQPWRLNVGTLKKKPNVASMMLEIDEKVSCVAAEKF